MYGFKPIRLTKIIVGKRAEISVVDPFSVIVYVRVSCMNIRVYVIK